jgi:transposase
MPGRHTKYRPEFCEVAISLMRNGAAIVEVAYELNVAKSTIFDWIKIHPEFAAAIQEGKDFSEGWWCKEGRLNIHNKEFNSTLFYMNMKNRFKWSDRTESSHQVHVTAHEESLRELDEK